jgi:methylmalonyl-CoA epimerase
LVHSAVHGLKLHHVGIVVGDLDAAVASYEVLGLANGDRFLLEEQGIEAVIFPAGDGWIELIQPIDPEGPIARFLAKRGDTVHHVAFASDSIERDIERLRSAGVRLIDESPRRGAHHWLIAFVHPESCNGVLVELVQTE